jgi:hypothetical protein
MTKTTKYLLAGGAAVVGFVAYRRWKAKQAPDAQAPATAAGAVSSLASKLSTETASFLSQLKASTPVELPSDTTVARTDLKIAARTVPASEVYRTRSQDALLAIDIFPRA